MILDFIKDNWQLIASVLTLICSLVIFILKKKPVMNEMDCILLKVMEKLPEWIAQAESLKGAEVKKSLVIESVKKFVKDEFSINLPDSYVALIGTYIENILLTPQKK